MRFVMIFEAPQNLLCRKWRFIIAQYCMLFTASTLMFSSLNSQILREFGGSYLPFSITCASCSPLCYDDINRFWYSRCSMKTTLIGKKYIPCQYPRKRFWVVFLFVFSHDVYMYSSWCGVSDPPFELQFLNGIMHFRYCCVKSVIALWHPRMVYVILVVADVVVLNKMAIAIVIQHSDSTGII